MNQNYFLRNQGFTLIELLVVIAIIGILSAIVLSSLDTARGKGQDGATKANLANSRAQAELYYDSQSPNTFAGVCNSTSGILNMLLGAKSSSGAAAVDTTSAHTGLSSTVECHDSSSGWAAEAPIKTPAGYWCVDNTGTSSAHTSGRIAASGVVCVAG